MRLELPVADCNPQILIEGKQVLAQPGFLNKFIGHISADSRQLISFAVMCRQVMILHTGAFYLQLSGDDPSSFARGQVFRHGAFRNFNYEPGLAGIGGWFLFSGTVRGPFSDPLAVHRGGHE